MKPAVCFIALGLVFGGCAIPARDRPAPVVPVAATWTSPSTGRTNLVGPSWWEGFGDSGLTRLIEVAFGANADLAILAERVELSRAEGGFNTANARPSAAASTGLRVGRENSRDTGFRTEGVMPWSVGGALAWEVDWLGKWKDRNSAAKETVQAARSDLNAGRLLLAAEAATAWFQLSRRREEVAILERSLKRQREILAIYRDRFRAGIVELSVIERQEAEAGELKRRELRAQMLAEVHLRRLNRLCGVAKDGGEHFALTPIAGVVIPGLPDALPVDVLRQRPDLAASEARLRAAFSLDRAARLDLFPSLSLKLGGATATGSLTNPFQSWITEAGPRLELPIWDPERLARSRSHSASARVAAAEYRAIALRAIEDVEVGLVRVYHRRLGLELAEEIARKARSVRERTDDKRRAGIVSQLEVLEDERRALTAELSELAIRSDVLIDLVTVYRAMAPSELDAPEGRLPF